MENFNLLFFLIHYINTDHRSKADRPKAKLRRTRRYQYNSSNNDIQNAQNAKIEQDDESELDDDNEQVEDEEHQELNDDQNKPR